MYQFYLNQNDPSKFCYSSEKIVTDYGVKFLKDIIIDEFDIKYDKGFSELEIETLQKYLSKYRPQTKINTESESAKSKTNHCGTINIEQIITPYEFIGPDNFVVSILSDKPKMHIDLRNMFTPLELTIVNKFIDLWDQNYSDKYKLTVMVFTAYALNYSEFWWCGRENISSVFKNEWGNCIKYIKDNYENMWNFNTIKNIIK